MQATPGASVSRGRSTLLAIGGAGSKDDGIYGFVGAPSDSEPRTGRPGRLSTWEIATDDRRAKRPTCSRAPGDLSMRCEGSLETGRSLG